MLHEVSRWLSKALTAVIINAEIEVFLVGLRSDALRREVWVGRPSLTNPTWMLLAHSGPEGHDCFCWGNRVAEDFKATGMSHSHKCDMLKVCMETISKLISSSLPSAHWACWKCYMTECERHTHTQAFLSFDPGYLSAFYWLFPINSLMQFLF